MANIIDFYEAKTRLRPQHHNERRGFLIIELPESMLGQMESRSQTWRAHLDIIID
ncbi:MAG TPA: hypothetical protein VFS88_08225 [Micavibrio sp.]|nr:hypothetical protein [Micavibrio sp.]